MFSRREIGSVSTSLRSDAVRSGCLVVVPMLSHIYRETRAGSSWKLKGAFKF